MGTQVFTDELGTWRTSSFTDGVQCAEVATIDGEIGIRNSNRRQDGHVTFTKGELAAFLTGAKAGEFDDLI